MLDFDMSIYINVFRKMSSTTVTGFREWEAGK